MRMAADVGFPLAFNEIGYAYAAGRHGLKKNAEQAKSWYERGAELGEKFCCFLLAQMYENGEGIAKDPAQAAHYFRVAAENGHGAALIFLARSQEKAGDFESAINSYSSAAIMSGDLDAAIHLADYYQHNNRLVEALTWLDFACAISVQKQLPGRAVELARCLSPDLVMQAIEAARRLKQAMSSRFPQGYNTGENFSHWLLFESSKAWERVNRLE